MTLIGLIGILPAVARAGQVTNVSVVNSLPSSAAGARTVYTVTFTTSSTGALSGSAGSKITITFPSGTNLSSLSGSSVGVGGQPVGSCVGSSGTTVTCEIYGAVEANAEVTVELDSVVNPSSEGSKALSVSTTSDTTATVSSSYSVSVAGQPTQIDVSPSSSAAGALTAYTITLATSATGGLSNRADSTITITLPSGTGVGASSGTVSDSGQTVGSCSGSAGTIVTCQISSTIMGRDELTVELGGIVNPGSTGSKTLAVSTSSDTTLGVSGNYSITTPNQPSNVSAANSPPSPAAGARTDYAVDFTTSATGALSSSAHSKITITFPAGTDPSSLSGSSVSDNGQQVGSCSSSADTTVTCEIYGTVGAGDSVAVELDGVVSPSAEGSKTLSVSTTSDTAAAVSSSYSVSVAGQPTQIDVSPSSSAAGALTAYTITLATSATGGLSSRADSTITITFPSGTNLSSASGSVSDNGQQLGSCGGPSGTTVTCQISSTITASSELTVEMSGVVNPGSTGSKTLTVSTSSDTSLGVSSNYSITTPNQPGNVSVINSLPSSAAGARTIYTVDFTTSATGALSGSPGSQIAITFPSGTSLDSASGQATDKTNGQQIGYCSGSGTAATCQISSKVAAGDEIAVELDGVTNPGSEGNKTLTVATTSDTASAVSSSYSVSAAAQPANLAVSDTISAAGALTVYKVAFTTSATGGLSSRAGSTITITFPSGTGLGPGSVSDNGQQVGYCNSYVGTTTTCQISGTVTAGDEVAIELNAMTNPATAGAKTLRLSTTSDTAQAISNSYLITTPNQPSQPTVADNSVSSAAGARTDYTIAFTTSATGALSSSAGSQITITFPQGTGMSSASGPVTDSTNGQQVGYCYGSGRTASCQISGPVAAGEEIAIELDSVTNPAAEGSKALTVSTTSDTTPSISGSYLITSPNQPGRPTVVNNAPSSAAGALTVYAITFTTSPTGGLSSKAGSQIVIVLPSGTGLGSASGSLVTDNTGGQQVGYCSGSGTLETCYISGTVTAGDSVTVTLDGVTNPAIAAPETLRLSTTSDTVATTSAPYGVGAPVAITGAASNISQTAAFVAGTVNPEDTAITDCHFDWGTSASYGQTAACSQAGGSGSSAELVTAALTGLTANTTYHFRMVATNAGGTSYGADKTLATLAAAPSMAAPSVFTSPPAGVGPEKAVFSALVDPAGLLTTAYFEYGLDPKYSGGGPLAYNQSTPVQTVGSDFAGHSVTASVADLVPDALYHFRLVAANGAGSTVGPDQTFTTSPSAPPPAPTLGRTVNVKPVGGLVLVKLAGSGRARSAALAHDALSKGEGFIPLTQPRQLPVGSQIDSRRGSLELVVASSQRHHTHTAELSEGLFTLAQRSAGPQRGLTTLMLDEGLFPGAPSYASCNAKATRLDPQAQSTKLSAGVVQRLKVSDNHGSFQTSGRYSSATVRGTSWDTIDRCDGTLTVVHRGAVDVLDFATRKTVTLHAGQSYLARAR